MINMINMFNMFLISIICSIVLLKFGIFEKNFEEYKNTKNSRRKRHAWRGLVAWFLFPFILFVLTIFSVGDVNERSKFLTLIWLIFIAYILIFNKLGGFKFIFKLINYRKSLKGRKKNPKSIIVYFLVFVVGVIIYLFLVFSFLSEDEVITDKAIGKYYIKHNDNYVGNLILEPENKCTLDGDVTECTWKIEDSMIIIEGMVNEDPVYLRAEFIKEFSRYWLIIDGIYVEKNT